MSDTMVTFYPKNQVATFVDDYGDTRIIHRPKGRRLSVFNGGNTPVLRLNRAVAILMGEKIRERRISKGMSQRELCLRAGLVNVNPKQYVSSIERAQRREGVRLGTLFALATALECDPSDLLPDVATAAKFAGVSATMIAPLQVTA